MTLFCLQRAGGRGRPGRVLVCAAAGASQLQARGHTVAGRGGVHPLAGGRGLRARGRASGHAEAEVGKDHYKHCKQTGPGWPGMVGRRQHCQHCKASLPSTAPCGEGDVVLQPFRITRWAQPLPPFATALDSRKAENHWLDS